MATEAEIEEGARAGYEQRIRQDFGCEPGRSWIAGSEQRTYAWDELPEFAKDRERTAAKAALEAVERARWQPIETLDATWPMLLYDEEWSETLGAIQIGHHDGKRYVVAEGLDFHPTHGQPLPSPPKDK